MQQESAKDRSNGSSEHRGVCSYHTCADGVDVLVPNRTFRLPEQDENGSGSKSHRITFMNGIVYMIDRKTKQPKSRLFVSESELDRTM